MPAEFLTHGARVAAAVALAFGMPACAGADAEQTGAARAEIIDGVPSTEEDDAVVRVRARVPGGGISNCTGSLVAPNLLLTARHCVAAYTEGVFTCTPEGELESSGQAGVMGSLAAPADISVYVGPGGMISATPDAVGAEIFALATPTICRNDIALVVLDRALDAPILPLRLTTATLPSERMTAIGYGVNELGVSGRRKRADVPVLLVGRSQYWTETSFAPARTFGIGPSSCQGDSGGPAITQYGAIAGVFSLSAGACTSDGVRNYYTQVAPFESLVRQAFAAAGAEPVLETMPGGSGGDGGATGEAGGGDTSNGGSGASGGTATDGGSGTSGGSGDTGGTAEPSSGTAGQPEEPRGSRRGGGCTCTTAPAKESTSSALLAIIPVALGLGLRRRQRLRSAE